MGKSKKIIIWIISIFLFSIILITIINKIDLPATKDYLKRKIRSKIICYTSNFGDLERSSKKLNNDYNVNFLPSTQFINLDLKKINLKIIFLNEDSTGYAQHLKIKVRQVFYIEEYKNNIIFLTSDGKLFYNDFNKIIEKKHLEIISNNLDLDTALDLLIDEEYIYVSGVIVESNCAYLVVYKAKLSNLNEFNFNNIFKSDECVTMIQSGRMAKYKDNSLLLATAADVLIKKMKWMISLKTIIQFMEKF